MIKMNFTTEFMPKYGITRSQWMRRKEELLQHLLDYFVYDIDETTRPITITIYDQLEEYQPLPRKARKTNTQQKINDYTEYVDSSLQKNKFNTPTNLGHNAKDLQEKYSHKEKTSANYCRQVLKDGNHQRTGEHIWCELVNGDYAPLEGQVLEFLRKTIDKHYKGAHSAQANIVAEIKQGTLEEQEGIQMIKEDAFSRWQRVRDDFLEAYGFIPISVPGWEIGVGFQENE